ncbi:MAG: sulfate/thiosulfate transport system permease protein [Frankiaceae bacterium]|nr:sulfate/thiosulfate transport system permease protein [Frankiaceae bacterium]
MTRNRTSAPRWGLRVVVLAYLMFLLVLPVVVILYRTFQHGLSPVFDALTTSDAQHAYKITAIVAVSAVVLNTVFGVAAAILLVRHRFPGRRILDAVIDLPIAVSPVVVGLALTLVYGRNTAVGSWFGRHGINIIFSLPGMVIATSFVALPLVVRAVGPVLEEIGEEQEQAAATLGASAFQRFTRITLPSIRGALAYGVVLSLARSLGEFGAVAVVSGRLLGKTETVPLYVLDLYNNFNQTGAYAASTSLVLVAVAALVASRFLRPRGAMT